MKSLCNISLERGQSYLEEAQDNSGKDGGSSPLYQENKSERLKLDQPKADVSPGSSMYQSVEPKKRKDGRRSTYH